MTAPRDPNPGAPAAQPYPGQQGYEGQQRYEGQRYAGQRPYPGQQGYEGQQYAGQRPYPGHQAYPAKSTPARRGRLLAGIAIGLVAAVLVGAVLVFTKVLGFGPDAASTGPDTTAIALPAQLGAFRDQAEAAEERAKGSSSPAAAAAGIASRLEHTYALTMKRYQQAFGGAAVAVRSYADDDLMFLPTVIAVRAPSPGLINGPVPDLDDLELAANPSTPTIQQDGQVECYVAASQVVPKGKTVDPADEFTSVCHRSSDALTVYVHGYAKGPSGHSDMVGLTNAAFDSVTARS